MATNRTAIRIHDTASRGTRDLSGGPLGIYACGVTPYDEPHVGHLRAAVVLDALVRFLRSPDGGGRTVRYVRNVTDIDDKIIRRAEERGEDPSLLALRYYGEYEAVLGEMGCIAPDEAPAATAFVPKIQEFISLLVERGHAYASGGSVWYRVRSFPEYGKLSGRKLEDLRDEHARIEPDSAKEDPIDFALWKSAKPGEPAWPSPWGPGRPGWHIECSAMSRATLGESFEIHAGGLDLVFPHHENEIAQSRGAGYEFARIWMHLGLVLPEEGGAKMSKSVGNVVPAREAIEKIGAARLRLLLLLPHYRSPLRFGPVAADEAHAAADRIATFFERVECPTCVPAPWFAAALADDLHTPRAFAALFDRVAEGNRLRDAGKTARALAIAGEVRGALEMIGLASVAERPSNLSAEDTALLAEREAARKARDFARADEIRAELDRRGIVVEDGPGGSRARKAARA